MNSRAKEKRIEGFNARNQGDHEYMKWQNLIEDSCPGLRCTVIMRPHTISIRTDSYTDYLLARSVVVKRTGLEVVRG
jgi:hypothetical protein